MKNHLTIAAGLIASAALMMAATPAIAGHVDVGVNIGLPGFLPAPVYVEPQPVYVQRQPVYIESRPVYIEREREGEWRERRSHARQWQERHEHRDEYRGDNRGDRHERHGHDD